MSAAGPSADFAVANPGPGEGWQLAIGLIRAWRGAGEHADGAVAQKLAEVVAEGGAATAVQAVTGLVALGNMFLELYAAWRLGLKDDFKQRVQDLVQPGTSALLVIVRTITPDKFIEALRPYGGTVLKTSLPRDAQQELMKALHGDDAARNRPSAAQSTGAALTSGAS